MGLMKSRQISRSSSGTAVRPTWSMRDPLPGKPAGDPRLEGAPGGSVGFFGKPRDECFDGRVGQERHHVGLMVRSHLRCPGGDVRSLAASAAG